MKTLLTLALSLIAFSASADSSNFNCSAQSKNNRENVLCSSSLVSDATKLANNCAAQVKQKVNKDGTVQ
jgi:hypothetical protein